jgi:hypothetical protein
MTTGNKTTTEAPKKYLYTNGRWGLRRYLIARETAKTYFLYINEVYEEPVRKNKMSTGTGWHVSSYKEETPELLALWNKAILSAKAKEACDYFIGHVNKLSGELQNQLIELAESHKDAHASMERG